MYRGLNNRLVFSIPFFLKWAHYKSDSHVGGINDKIIDTLNELNDEGYITYCGDTLSRTGSIEIEINTEYIGEACSNGGYGVVYLDEIEKIMKCSIDNKTAYFNCNTVLLVFAYLRDAIFRIPNKLKPEECYPERIEERRKRCPEAYNDTYKDIGLEIGVSAGCVSDAVKVLTELKLIVFEEAYHFKNEENEYRTPDIIFANAYKREDKKQLTFDDSYARMQILNKEEQMKKYFKEYVLKKQKPLFKKIG